MSTFSGTHTFYQGSELTHPHDLESGRPTTFNFGRSLELSVWSTQRRTLRNILPLAWNLQVLRELAYHRITAFPGKLKGVLHSQEDCTNIFPASCITRVNFLRFITSIHIFSNFSNIVQGPNKNFCHFVVPTPISQKSFVKRSLNRCISSCQQDKHRLSFSAKCPL